MTELGGFGAGGGTAASLEAITSTGTIIFCPGGGDEEAVEVSAVVEARFRAFDAESPAFLGGVPEGKGIAGVGTLEI